ncbi:MAG: DASH family cryptochrome [Pyrinomonas sp.]|mgnify:CR=1 FL=1|uniref:DASH family cryptochrome n=1 Tax=Pyrinomonas sp. TaxID=2080306 RepID=UPI00331B43F7
MSAGAARHKKGLIWFWNNLRTHDNQALNRAMEECDELIAVYIAHPKDWQHDEFGFFKTGPFRAAFLKETVLDLQENLRRLNVPLYLFHEEASEALRRVHVRFPFEAVYFQNEWTKEERDVIRGCRWTFPQVEFRGFYDQLLYHPERVGSLFRSLPDVFTQFRQKLEKRLDPTKPLPEPSPKSQRVALDLPTALPACLERAERRTHPHSAFALKGGEGQAQRRLQYYLFDSHLVRKYKETRNGLIGLDYSSKLSPFLANGSLSVRVIVARLRAYEAEFGGNDSTYWLFFELLWREFFKYVSMEHGDWLFHRSGIRRKKRKWREDEGLVQSWTDGRTSSPFVNANMLEIKQTGWMSNRGRQVVASYLAKHLEVDWRIGAAYFESALVDYDVHSNYGNWQYVAGVGNDPRDRVFDPELQAQRYDSGGEYRRLWLKEAASF